MRPFSLKRTLSPIFFSTGPFYVLLPPRMPLLSHSITTDEHSKILHNLKKYEYTSKLIRILSNAEKFFKKAHIFEKVIILKIYTSDDHFF